MNKWPVWPWNTFTHCFFFFYSPRVYLLYHTWSQVIYGGVAGSTFGIVWFFFTQEVLTPIFPKIAAWYVVLSFLWFLLVSQGNTIQSQSQKLDELVYLIFSCYIDLHSILMFVLNYNMIWQANFGVLPGARHKPDPQHLMVWVHSHPIRSKVSCCIGLGWEMQSDVILWNE